MENLMIRIQGAGQERILVIPENQVAFLFAGELVVNEPKNIKRYKLARAPRINASINPDDPYRIYATVDIPTIVVEEIVEEIVENSKKAEPKKTK